MPELFKVLSQQEILEIYGPDTLVATGKDKAPMPLGSALQAEMLCPINHAERQDPIVRGLYLAKILNNAGTLHPEHLYMLGQEE